MTEAEAVVAAGRYLAERQRETGPFYFARYSTGTEYDPTCRPPPHWAIYFWYDAPVAEPPEDLAQACFCVAVDDATGAARVVTWL